MARRRFFVPGIHHQRAELAGDDALHLTRVLRVQRGQQFEISDNHAVWLAEVTEARKERVVFAALEKLPLRPPPVRLILLVSLIKFDRLEWIFEKGAELGVERFVPVAATRSEKGLDRAALKRMSRWERILVEASQQSRRDRLPELAEPVSFRAALATPADLRLFLEEQSAPPVLAGLPAERNSSDSVAILLGPEGGWTDAERGEAAAAGWAPVSLGPQVLRAETAAVAAAAILSAAWLRP